MAFILHPWQLLLAIFAGLHEHHAPSDYIEHVKARILKNNPDLRTQV